MSAPRIRADYDALQKTAAAFGQQAEAAARSLSQLKGQMQVLQGGDWVGKGATAFYAEMNDQVVPTLQRLVNALHSAATTTTQISQAMKSAEDEAARILHADRVGMAVAGAAAAAGIAAAAGGLADGGGASAGGASGPGGAGSPASFAGAGGAGAAIPAGASAFGPTVAPPAGPGSAYIQGGAMKAPDTNGLPDASGVNVYRGLPQEGGGYNMGAGWSRAVGVWGDRFKQQLPAIDDQRTKLDDTKAVMAQTMQEEGADVRAASKNMAHGLKQLNKATDGTAYHLVKEYQWLGDMARLADRKAGVASKMADAALKKYEAAQEAVKIHEASVQKQSLADQRAEIEKRIAERTELINTVIDLASDAATAERSAAGLAEFGIKQGAGLLKKIVGGMTDAEQRELIAIDAKISALDDAIGKATDTQVRAQLQAAKSEMEGAFDQYVAAKVEARITEQAQWGKLDELAALEAAHPSTGKVFRELQDYNNQVRWVGDQLRDQTDGYLKTLNNSPFGDAADLSQRVGVDIKHNQVYGPPDEAWTGSARGTQRYLDQLARWQQGEVATHEKLRNELAQGRHLELVDSTMAAADKALGGTVTEEHTVR